MEWPPRRSEPTSACKTIMEDTAGPIPVETTLYLTPYQQSAFVDAAEELLPPGVGAQLVGEASSAVELSEFEELEAAVRRCVRCVHVARVPQRTVRPLPHLWCLHCLTV